VKRSFERSLKLPPFSCDLAAFESLVNEIRGSMDPAASTLSLSVTIPDGQLIEVASFDELRTVERLPGRIRQAEVRILEMLPNGRRSWNFFTWSGEPRVLIKGDSAAWCAGLADRTAAFANQHRTWARWFIEWGSLLFTAAVGGLSLTATGQVLPLQGKVPLMVAVVIVIYLYFARDRFFPTFIVELRNEEGFLTRHAPMIALTAAVVAAIAAVLQLFLSAK
jgi:hypothetical protein